MKEIFLISTEGTEIMVDEQGSTFMARERFLSPNNETKVVIRGTYKKEQP